MPRKGMRDLAKEQHWRGVIRELRSSEISVAAFCRLHGHKYHQLQEWQRIIRERDAELASVQRKLAGPRPTRAAARTSTQDVVHFVPAKITDSLTERPALPSQPSIELVLRCGVRLRITPACPPEFLSLIVTSLEKRPC
jgi:hypothetical protein